MCAYPPLTPHLSEKGEGEPGLARSVPGPRKRVDKSRVRERGLVKDSMCLGLFCARQALLQEVGILQG